MLLALLAAAASAAAQETITAEQARITERAVIGGATLPTSGVLRLVGVPARTAGQAVLGTTAAGDVTAGALVKGDLPAATAYEDEANTFALLQTFAAGLATTTLTASSLAALNGGATTTTLAASGVATFNAPARSLTYTSRTTGWAIDAAGRGDFRSLYTDELHAREFIADLEMALNGGQTIAKSTVVLALPFTCPAAAGTAALRVRDFPGFPNVRVFSVNDWVVMRAFSRTDGDGDGLTDLTIGDCVGQVTAYADQVDDTQIWTFTRGAGGNAGAMATSTVVAAEALVVDYGVSGQGFLVARANDGAEGANSPYWQVNTWTTAPVAANMTARMRCGNLNGSYSYASAAYGCAFGDPAAANVTIDPTNGVRIRYGTSNRLQADAAGNLSLVSGNVTIDNAGIRIVPTTVDSTARAYVWTSALAGRVTLPGAYFYEQGGGASDASVLAVQNGGSNNAIHSSSLSSGNSGAVGSITTQSGTADANTVIALTLSRFATNTSTLSITPAGFLAVTAPFLGGAAVGGFTFGNVLTVRFDGSTSNPGRPWIRGDGNELVINTPGALRLAWDSGSGVILGNVAYVKGAVYPYNSGINDLGDSSLKWRDIYFSEPTTTAAGLFPLVTSSGRIMAKSNGLNGTTTCAGAQRVSAITFAFGIATGITCS